MIRTNPLTLRIHKHPGVIEFKITNVPPNTIWRQILSYIGFLIRLSFIATAVCAIYLIFAIRTRISFIQLPASPPQSLLYFVSLLKVLDAQSIIYISTTTIYLSVFGFRGYSEEYLVMIKEIDALVIGGTRVTWWGQKHQTMRFIQLISEGQFWRDEYEGRYFLAVVVDGTVDEPDQDMVVIFPTLKPDKKMLDIVWVGVRRFLHRPKRREEFMTGDDSDE